jgi:hypothetical protein
MAMFIGALIGALLVINVNLVLPLGIAALLMAISAFAAHRLSTEESAEWAQRPKPL